MELPLALTQLPPGTEVVVSPKPRPKPFTAASKPVLETKDISRATKDISGFIRDLDTPSITPSKNIKHVSKEARETLDSNIKSSAKPVPSKTNPEIPIIVECSIAEKIKKYGPNWDKHEDEKVNEEARTQKNDVENDKNISEEVDEKQSYTGEDKNIISSKTGEIDEEPIEEENEDEELEPEEEEDSTYQEEQFTCENYGEDCSFKTFDNDDFNRHVNKVHLGMEEDLSNSNSNNDLPMFDLPLE